MQGEAGVMAVERDLLAGRSYIAAPLRRSASGGQWLQSVHSGPWDTSSEGRREPEQLQL